MMVGLWDLKDWKWRVVVLLVFIWFEGFGRLEIESSRFTDASAAGLRDLKDWE